MSKRRQPVPPSIFAIGNCSDLIPQLAVGFAAKDACHRANLPFRDPDSDLGIASDVLDPRGSFAGFGQQIKMVTIDDKPNLDLARQTRPPPDCSQIKDFLVRKFLDTRQSIEAS